MLALDETTVHKILWVLEVLFSFVPYCDTCKGVQRSRMEVLNGCLDVLNSADQGCAKDF